MFPRDFFMEIFHMRKLKHEIEIEFFCGEECFYVNLESYFCH